MGINRDIWRLFLLSIRIPGPDGLITAHLSICYVAANNTSMYNTKDPIFINLARVLDNTLEYSW